MSDQQVVDGLYAKHYSDMPKIDFYKSIGFTPDMGGLDGWSGYDAGFKEGGLLDTAVSGVTMGLSERVGAAGTMAGDYIADLIEGKETDFGKSYDEGLARQRGLVAGAHDKNPILAPVAEYGMAMMVPTGLAKSGVNKALPFLSAGKKDFAANVLGGAAAGGITGFAKSDDAAEGAGVGGIVGAGVGAALPPALKLGAAVIGAPIRAIANRIGSGPSSNAARVLARDLAESGDTPDQLARRLNKLGSRSTIADATKGEATDRAENLAQQSVGRPQADAAMSTRGASGGASIMNETRVDLGLTQGFKEADDALIAMRQKDAAPLYRDAFSADDVYSPRLQEFLDSPEAARSLREGMTVLRREALAKGEPFDPASFGVGSNGGPPNMQTLDAIKRGIDEMLEKYRDGTTGRLVLDQKGRALEGVRKAYVEELDRLNPAYKKARDAWAGPWQLRESMSKGRMFLRGDAEYKASDIANMTASEKDFFRLGAIRELEQQFGGTQTAASVSKKLMSRKFKPVLEAAFPDKKSYARFVMRMAKERRLQERSNKIRDGSPTFARKKFDQQGGGEIDSAITDLAMGNVAGAGANTSRGMFSAARSFLTDLPKSTKKELANAMFSRDKKVQDAFIDKMRERVQMGELSDKQFSEISGYITRTSAYSASKESQNGRN